ncbi:MAG: hypothetical protein KGI26_03430 [Thaumarchaeota archaeon]|nr:hypothetical protein [Nitrososphaerota archaeon]
MQGPQAPDYSAALQPKHEPGFYRMRLEGAVDFQLHLAPDVVRRACYDVNFLEVAEKVGYRAMVLKDHYVPTTGRALLLNKRGGPTKVFGGTVLNNAVGGLNPAAVEAAVQQGAAQVWMPTFDARNHREFFNKASLPELHKIRQTGFKEPPGITLLDEAGEILPAVHEILGQIASADVILGTGHVSLEETYALVQAAKRAGVQKVLITHPRARATNWSTDDHAKLVEMGATLEHCASANYNSGLIRESVERVGAENCILSSDSGQVHHGHPLDYFMQFLNDLASAGVSDGDLRAMTVDNPSKLLGI